MGIMSVGLASAAEEAVRAAGELLCADGAVHEVHEKNRTDFVTDVDLSVQERLRARLAGIAPEAQFMGEEQDNSGIDLSRPFWILDPVDGTTNMIRRLRHSAVSLALAEGGELVFGAVWNPYAREMFTARRGEGAYLNGKRIHVSDVRSAARALVSVGTAPGHREWTEEVFRDMRVIFDRSLDVRRSGCASLDLCDVACGRTDAYTERVLFPWDYAAGALIVSEAGGRVTNCGGGPVSLISAGGLLSSNGLLHEEMLEMLI